MKSKDFRNSKEFLRNEYQGSGKYRFPLVRKQLIEDLSNLQLIDYSNIGPKNKKEDLERGVNFCIDDYKFNTIYFKPEKAFERLKDFKFLCGPDFSVYYEMQPWRQIESIGHSRWCCAYWQSKGKIVFPTVSWGSVESFDYCFDAIEEGSIVVVGMIGAKRNNRFKFMLGYNEMLKRIKPTFIICIGEPFPEMKGNIIKISYAEVRNGGKNGR